MLGLLASPARLPAQIIPAIAVGSVLVATAVNGAELTAGTSYPPLRGEGLVKTVTGRGIYVTAPEERS